MKRILIVGAGWAGLSAAVQATKLGAKVTLIEAKKELGGRARSVELGGYTLDNGQHIMIGAYQATQSLMSTVGLQPNTKLLRYPLSLRNFLNQGFELQGSPRLSQSLKFLYSTLECSIWGVADKYALLRFALKWRLKGFLCSPQSTVSDICSGLTPNVIDSFITPLCLSAFNSPIELTSGQVFLKVLRDAMFSGPGSSDFLIPRCDLGALFPRACESWLLDQGCTILKGRRVDSLIGLENGRGQTQLVNEANAANAANIWTHLEDGGDLSVDAIVVACDSTNAARLLRPINPQWAKLTEQIEHTQISTVYLRCKDPSFKGLHKPLVMLSSDAASPSAQIKAPAQFAFDTEFLFNSLNQSDASPLSTQPQDRRGLLSFVCSYARLTNEQISAGVLEQARNELGLTEVEHIGTITERRAAFCYSPNLTRPSNHVAGRIWACGDYVEGPYPSTLEGAVLSGIGVIKNVAHALETHSI